MLFRSRESRAEALVNRAAQPIARDSAQKTSETNNEIFVHRCKQDIPSLRVSSQTQIRRQFRCGANRRASIETHLARTMPLVFVSRGIVAGDMTPRQDPCQESSSVPAEGQRLHSLRKYLGTSPRPFKSADSHKPGDFPQTVKANSIASPTHDTCRRA